MPGPPHAASTSPRSSWGQGCLASPGQDPTRSTGAETAPPLSPITAPLNLTPGLTSPGVWVSQSHLPPADAPEINVTVPNSVPPLRKPEPLVCVGGSLSSALAVVPSEYPGSFPNKPLLALALQRASCWGGCVPGGALLWPAPTAGEGMGRGMGQRPPAPDQGPLRPPSSLCPSARLKSSTALGSAAPPRPGPGHRSSPQEPPHSACVLPEDAGGPDLKAGVRPGGRMGASCFHITSAFKHVLCQR